MAQTGLLDNKTILRFSHALSGGGGVEVHIDNLNRMLLSRNAVKILYLYLPEEDGVEITEESAGRGTLVKIPLRVDRSSSVPFREGLNRYQHNLFISFFRKTYSRFKYLNQYVLYKAGKQMFMPYFREVSGFKEVLAGLFKEHKVDLIVNHFPGGRDSLQLMAAAAEVNIPVLIINHFDNAWFNYFPIRQQVDRTRYVSGVTGINIPGYLRRRFINISNGVDTDYFDPWKVSFRTVSQYPVLLLPARIWPMKGHLDLLQTAHMLRSKGITCFLVFAGRCDSDSFREELYTWIKKKGMKDQVMFTGLVNHDSLRQYYRSSTLVVLPTYQEGFGRVVVEAQSMGVPPVAYDVGGLKQSLIKGKTGILVKKGDRRALCEAIEGLLKDEKRRKEMGREGRNFVERVYSLRSLVERHERVYEMIIRGEPAVKLNGMIDEEMRGHFGAT
ncbi:MAG: glycosyltransferase family 4 protein [Fibrobacter sp.]|jgi:glycosyltransferase involved in cell wall biosynthesis|nr:glycosyltransferase family 4 protein [Fibrobacter sp.]